MTRHIVGTLRNIFFCVGLASQLLRRFIRVRDVVQDSRILRYRSIPDPVTALREMRRVLKDDGRLIFVEHGLARERHVQAWQNRLNRLWRRIASGCNLNRSIDTLLVDAGFDITQLETGYLKGPKPFAFLYKGLAQPA